MKASKPYSSNIFWDSSEKITESPSNATLRISLSTFESLEGMILAEAIPLFIEDLQSSNSVERNRCTPIGVHLFLSTELEDCKSSIKSGIASARIMPSRLSKVDNEILKVAFDGDSVIFSEESQKIFDEYGLEAFNKNEKNLADNPLSGGPFKSFLRELYKVQQSFPRKECPIRIALVTARSNPSHERVIKTLREWKIRVDESLFLGGMDKTNFLKNFGADIFFDDQIENCKSACLEVPTGQVINFNSGI